MLLPETIATILPRARPESAATTAQPAAPSAITWQWSATNLMAAATSSSGTTMEPASNRDSSGHIVGSTDLPPAPSTNDACHASKEVARPFFSEASNGAAVSGSAAKTCTWGRSDRTAEATPAASPPPPSGAITASTSGRSRMILSPAMPLPAMNRSSSKGWTKQPPIRSDACVSTVRQHSSYVARTILAPSRSIASSFVTGAVSTTIYRARHACHARRQRDPLRRVVRADRPDASAGIRGRQPPDHVKRASDLE